MPVDLAALADDLRAETAVLDALLAPLDEAGWRTPTPAPGWSIHDQISHLAYVDDQATLAATDPDAYRVERDAMIATGSITETVAQRSRSMSGEEVAAWFASARARLLATYATLDPSARVPWYGPEMSVASALTARIMETWAHGQDVADALGMKRTPTAALRQVAHIGVRAFPNSFVAHGLDVPDVVPFVAVKAPDGTTWTWGDADASERVEGDAIDFCLVVTQRRNVADTTLVASGAIAQQWMQVAQAFAGPPGAGRAPGQFAS